MLCDNKDLRFTVLESCGKCGKYRKGETHKFSSIIPEGHCYEMLHSLLPYMVTYKNSGWFKWERDKDSVIVCCPSVENNVCVRIKKVINNGEVDFKYEIINVRGECKYYKKGSVLEINSADFDYLCWDLYNTIYVYSDLDFDGMKISCSSVDNNGVFRLG